MFWSLSSKRATTLTGFYPFLSFFYGVEGKDENIVAADKSGVVAVAATMNVFYRRSQPYGCHKPIAGDTNRYIYVSAATPL